MKNMFLILMVLCSLNSCAKEYTHVHIIDKPIHFDAERIAMTKECIKTHYGKTVDNIEITPKIIVLHWTADMSFDKSFNHLKPPKFFTDRKDIAKASLLNVSSQFLVARDGTIYRLMPENWMATDAEWTEEALIWSTTAAANESEMKVIKIPYRQSDGPIQMADANYFHWTSDISTSANMAYARMPFHNFATGRFKSQGITVRCIMDE